MPYIATSTITAALQAWLKLWKQHEEDAAATFGAAVYRYDAPELEQALNDLLKFDAPKVALIVPGQERYSGPMRADEPTVRSRMQDITLILAVRELAPTPNTDTLPEFDVVVNLKDKLFSSLAAAPSVSVPGIALLPEGGGPLMVRDSDGIPLYRAWAARLTTFAGHQGYAVNTLS